MKILIHITLASLATISTTTAQRPNLVGEVQGEAKKRLSGASVTFHPSPRLALTCLEDQPIAEVRAQPLHTQTSESGKFGLTVASPPRGALIVSRPKGPKAILGAIVFHPTPPIIIPCRPMAELRLDARFDVHIQALDENSEPVYIGNHEAVDRLRLPEGHYRFLLLGAGVIREHELRLRSGDRTELPTPPKAKACVVELRQVGRHRVHLRHWPQVTLPVRDAKYIDLPRRGHPVRLLVVTTRAGCDVVRATWIESSGLLPPKAKPNIHRVRVIDEDGRPVSGARILSVRGDPARSMTIASIGVTDARGQAAYDSPTDHDDAHLIVLAGGFVSTSLRLSKEGVNEVTLKQGHALRLQVIDPRGEPAGHVGVEIVREDAPLLGALYRTDRHGVLSREDLPKGLVGFRLRSPRMLAETREVVIIPGRPNRKKIRAKPGFVLRGRVLVPGGAPGARAVVTLRPNNGHIDHSRTTLAGADGSFQFFGLAEDARLRLSARLTNSTGTFISTRMPARPSDSVSYEITLKSEDPTFPGRRRGK